MQSAVVLCSWKGFFRAAHSVVREVKVAHSNQPQISFGPRLYFPHPAAYVADAMFGSSPGAGTDVDVFCSGGGVFAFSTYE